MPRQIRRPLPLGHRRSAGRCRDVSDQIIAGIDFGGTKIVALVATADGRMIGDARLPTLVSKGTEAVINDIVLAVKKAAAKAGVSMDKVRGAGIAANGPIDNKEGIITEPPNLPGWRNVALARILTERLGMPAWLENDANCQALAEHEYGAGRGFRNMIFMTISTGVGAGIIIDNKLYSGATGGAGEIGHLIVAPNGRACGAGHPGCLEAYASGTGIVNRARELIRAGGLPRVASFAEQNPPLSAETVHMAAQQGESEAMEIITTAGRYLGMGLASVINVFNPEAIVLGGGLINIGDDLLNTARQATKERAFKQNWRDVRIIEGELGERSAALGAITVARDRVVA